MTERQIRKLLKREIERAGGVRALSREWGISPPVISMAANGRRKPGPLILKRLNVTASVTYSRRIRYAAS